jgi:DNA-binding transcriptional ArsR family regulator
VPLWRSSSALTPFPLLSPAKAARRRANAKEGSTNKQMLNKRDSLSVEVVCSASTDCGKEINERKAQVGPRDTTETQTRIQRGQSGKSVEERVAYAIGHRTRVYVLTILNEGVYNVDEIAAIIGERNPNVAHHVKELLDAGSIELAKTEKVRNTLQHYYRAVEMPIYTGEEWVALTSEERQATLGLTIQCLTAEMMSAFWAGKMESDPRTWLAWRWLNLDEQGRQDLEEEQERSWKRAQEIEAEATNRRAESGEESRSFIVASAGFQRERSSPTPPVSLRER